MSFIRIILLLILAIALASLLTYSFIKAQQGLELPSVTVQLPEFVNVNSIFNYTVIFNATFGLPPSMPGQTHILKVYITCFGILHLLKI